MTRRREGIACSRRTRAASGFRLQPFLKANQPNLRPVVWLPGWTKISSRLFRQIRPHEPATIFPSEDPGPDPVSCQPYRTADCSTLLLHGADPSTSTVSLPSRPATVCPNVVSCVRFPRPVVVCRACCPDGRPKTLVIALTRPSEVQVGVADLSIRIHFRPIPTCGPRRVAANAP